MALSQIAKYNRQLVSNYLELISDNTSHPQNQSAKDFQYALDGSGLHTFDGNMLTLRRFRGLDDFDPMLSQAKALVVPLKKAARVKATKVGDTDGEGMEVAVTINLANPSLRENIKKAIKEARSTVAQPKSPLDHTTASKNLPREAAYHK